MRIAATSDLNVHLVAPEPNLLYRLIGVLDLLFVVKTASLFDHHVLPVLVVKHQADVRELSVGDTVVALSQALLRRA